MKILCCLLLVFLFIFPSFGQEDTSPDWIKVLSYGVGNKTDQNVLSIEEANSRTNQCTPSDFAYANLLLGNDSVVEQVIVKYDYKEKVLLIRQENQVIVGAPNMVKSVQFSDSSINELINVGQVGRSYGRRGFYTVLAHAKNNFLVKYMDMEEKTNSSNTNMPSNELYAPPKIEPVFVKNEELLISKNQQVYVLNNLKPKTLSQFGAESDLLKSYVKENKLKFKSIDDLTLFAEYFWSL